ncbi:hypothetical protein [Paraburkholderia fungorum]|uniref:hypothetical protein n=1 Tax=Paraburkholderia fungorum TaxID=134537 RepID=UPI002097AD3D|nr:hypothetical protein [Paraburkholderia fungorum]USX03826.1 hypothetical protein NHH62_11650 [Paraburkholderia fungorum]
MQQFDITVPVTGGFVVHAPGKYIKYVSGSNGGNDASLMITPGAKGGNKIVLYPGQAYRVADNAPTPDSWTLANSAGSATIIGKVVVGDGRIDDNTLTGTVSTIDGGKARTLAGGAFLSNLFSAASAGNYGCVQLINPAASGKRLVIEQLWLNSNAAGAAQFWADNGAAISGTTAGAPQNKLPGGPASAMQGWAATQAGLWAAVGGFNYMGSCFITANVLQGFNLREPIVIPPGYGFKVALQTANATVQAVLEYYEEQNV